MKGDRQKFLIVDFCLLIENEAAPCGANQKARIINHDLLGRRLMVGQVPLEHFV